MLFKKTALFCETSLESVRLEKYVNLSDCTLVYNFLAILLSNNGVLFSDNTHIHCHGSVSQIKKKLKSKRAWLTITCNFLCWTK